MGASQATPHQLALTGIARRDRVTLQGRSAEQASHAQATQLHDAPMHTHENSGVCPGQHGACTQHPPWAAGQGEKGCQGEPTAPPCMPPCMLRPCAHASPPPARNSRAPALMPPLPTLGTQIKAWALTRVITQGAEASCEISGRLSCPVIREVTTSKNGHSYAEWLVILTFDATNAADVNAAAAIGHALAHSDTLHTSVWLSDYTDVCTGNPVVSAPGDVPLSDADWIDLKRAGHVVSLNLVVVRDDQPTGNELGAVGLTRILTHINRTASATPGLAFDDTILMLNASALRMRQTDLPAPGIFF
jgi:hypothetical protein